MAKKKKLSKEERKRIRLQKGRQWLVTYQGTPRHLLKHYKERFHVDGLTAAKDLQELGVNYTQERLAYFYKDCDDRFAFIAGYTSGGAAFGTTWEEMGIDPMLPF
jgi:hypothetical protein